ncbi:MAG: 2-C-methyl-D-erythritol 4-phosphate cytidylyltransferase [Acidimicrobiales bacterium]
MSVWTIVVAAGGGSRFGAPKQFAMLGGRPLVVWALDGARHVSDGVVLVVPADAIERASSMPADAVVTGGASRCASVRAGLDAVPDDAQIIVVHDGARPLAGATLFRAVVGAVRDGADGAIPGLEVADTVKRVENGAVTGTVDRSGLVAVQTPQAFRAEWLRRAHRSGADATDDAGLVESLGATVRVVPGDPRNLKVTTPADLEVVQALLDR